MLDFEHLINDVRFDVDETSVESVYNQIINKDDFILIDVREDREWALNRIQQAIHIGKGVLERDIEKIIPNKSQSIVLYCGGGSRSILAARSLLELGYSNVKSMSGGIREWMLRGFNVASTS